MSITKVEQKPPASKVNYLYWNNLLYLYLKKLNIKIKIPIFKQKKYTYFVPPISYLVIQSRIK